MTAPERILALLELAQAALSEGKIGDICSVSSHMMAPILARLESSGAVVIERGPGFVRQKLYRIAK